MRRERESCAELIPIGVAPVVSLLDPRDYSYEGDTASAEVLQENLACAAPASSVSCSHSTLDQPSDKPPPAPLGALAGTQLSLRRSLDAPSHPGDHSLNAVLLSETRSLLLEAHPTPFARASCAEAELAISASFPCLLVSGNLQQDCQVQPLVGASAVCEAMKRCQLSRGRSVGVNAEIPSSFFQQSSLWCARTLHLVTSLEGYQQSCFRSASPTSLQSLVNSALHLASFALDSPRGPASRQYCDAER